MKAANFSLAEYFNRISYPAASLPSSSKIGIKELSAIMRQQLFTVPFENTQVQAGSTPSLKPENIVTKIIEHKRGGYCYEVNGLFALALEAMGVDYYFVAARPMFYSTMRPKTHMAIIVELDGERYLCDLGFGSYGLRAPFPVSQLDVEIQQDSDAFKLTQTGEREYCLQAKVNGAWANQFGFDFYPQEWIDFSPANHMNATHHDSIFVQKLLIVQHHEQGRTILFGSNLKHMLAGATSHTEHIDKADLHDIVLREFGLQMPYTAPP